MPRRSLVSAAFGLLAVALAAATVSVAPARAGARDDRGSGSYRNPVSKDFADTFADPAVLRGEDGWWYSYGTSDPLREGEGTAHRLPIARSRDLTSWEEVGDAFTAATLPSWAAPDASLWAPDVRYVDGEYRLYYVVTQTTVTAGPNDNAIGMATAPTPAGPWTDSGAPVVGPRPGGSGNADDFLWTFDPAVVTDVDGSQWLFYGSYYGGMHVTALTEDGRRATGPSRMVAIDNKFEGAYPVRRGGYWYLFASTANCCAGPTTGYSVQVGRSRDLRGPYVDRRGVSLTASRAGGTPTLVQNGNRWVGAGHNAVVSDLAGQDWIAYHAIDRADPYLDGADGINERPMLLDRLDWVDGWPAVRAGLGPSAERTAAPVTGGRYVTDLGSGIPRGWVGRPGWTEADDAQVGGWARSRRAAVLLAPTPRQGVQVQADLRSTGAPIGLRSGLAGGGTVSLVVDPARERVVLTETRRGRTISSTRSALPAGFDARQWHSASLQVVGRTARAQLGSSGLADPFVDLGLRLRTPSARGWSGAVAGGRGAGVDDLSVVRAARPVTRLATDRVPDRLDRSRSDEFSGSALAAGWSWVREDAAATVAGGELVWPTEAADLTGTRNDAGLLLRDPGPGDWTVETRLTTDLGVDTIRNYQQGGLVAYVDDDLFTRLSNVAIWNTRQTEFGKEMPYAGRLAYGGTIVGPPATTTWLRISQRLDRAQGERELRAWTSRDGRDWDKGGVWTLPLESDVRVGLVSHGGAGATSRFDYFRVYRAR